MPALDASEDEQTFPADEHRTPDSGAIERWLSRRRRIDVLLRWLRSCAHCKSVWPPIDILCPQCWAQLLVHENRAAGTLQPDYPFPVHSLFTWTEENERLVRSFLRGFKRGWCFGAAARLTERITFARAGDWAGESPLFVHPPSSSARCDHSWLLAQCFAREWGFVSGPAVALRATTTWSKASQKSKSAADRSLVRYEREEKFSGLGRPVVFVDDVITTGSTAMAAYMALGDPSRFAVWTLACRPKRHRTIRP